MKLNRTIRNRLTVLLIGEAKKESQHERTITNMFFGFFGFFFSFDH